MYEGQSVSRRSPINRVSVMLSISSTGDLHWMMIFYPRIFTVPGLWTHISTTPHPQLQLLLDIARCIYQIVHGLTPNPRNGITTTAISCVSNPKDSRPLWPRYLCDDNDRYIRDRSCSRGGFFSLISFVLPSLFVRGFCHSLGRRY